MCSFNFTDFYKKNFKRLRDYAGTFGLQVSDSEDVAQNILIELWRKIQNGRANTDDPNFIGYINKLARWRIIDKSRQNITKNKDISCIGEENNLDELAADIKMDNSWKWEIVRRATKLVKSKVSSESYFYFAEQVFNNQTAESLHEQYGISKNHAHLTKCRVGKKVIAAAKELIRNGI